MTAVAWTPQAYFFKNPRVWKSYKNIFLWAIEFQRRRTYKSQNELDIEIWRQRLEVTKYSIAILVGFLSGSCPGSRFVSGLCPVRVRVRVRFVSGFVSGLVSGFISGSCPGSYPVRVRVRIWVSQLVSGFASDSYPVRVWFLPVRVRVRDWKVSA